MHLASLDTFFEYGENRQRIGRPVANEAFMKALLSYAKCESFTFFTQDAAQETHFKQRLSDLSLSPDRVAPIRSYPQTTFLKRFASGNFSLLHQGDFTYYLPALATIRNRTRRPVPLVGVTHSLDGPRMHQRFWELSMAGLSEFDGIVCTSRTAEQFIQQKRQEMKNNFASTSFSHCDFPVETTVIPLGVDEEYFSPGDSGLARAKLQIPKDYTVFLTVGRLSLRSKCDLSPFFELLAKMKNAGQLQKTLFLFAGGSTKESTLSLQNLIDSLGIRDVAVLFPNFPAELKPDLYRSADVALALADNYQETFGLSVIEAMASGLPMLASDFDGYRDSIHHGENGFLIPTLAAPSSPDFLRRTRGLLDPSLIRFFDSQSVAIDLEYLETSMVRLMREPSLRQRLGQESRMLAQAYSWKTLIPCYEAFWAHLIDKAARCTIPEPATLLFEGGSVSAYAHYPTRVLDGKTIIRCTKYTAKARIHPEEIIRYADLDAVWNPALENWILTAVSMQDQTADSLRAGAKKEIGVSGEDLDFHLLWLMKHGLLAWSDGIIPNPI